MLEHGKAICRWQGDTLLISTQGSFNVEGALKADLQIKALVSEKQQEKGWLRLDTPDENSLGSPQVMAIFVQNYQWAFAHGCKAMALVCLSNMQQELAKSFATRSKLNIKVFSCSEMANRWLSCF